MIELDQIPDILTISDLQKILQVGRSTAYRLIKSHEIQSIRIGRSIRIPKKYVKEFIDSQNIPKNDNSTAVGEAHKQNNMDGGT